MNTFSKVRELVMSLEDDFEKFYDKQNQAAGTRVRKGMQDLKNMATEIRKSVQDMKNEKTGTDAAAAKGGAKAAAKPAAKGKK